MGAKHHPAREAKMQTAAPEKSCTQDQSILNFISEAISANLGEADIQAGLVEQIGAILGVELCALVILHEGRAEMVARKIGTDEPAWALPVRLNWDHGLIEGCIREQSTLTLNELPAEAHLELFQSIPDLKVRSLLCAPLIVNEQALAILSLANKIKGPFDDSDKISLTRIAAILAQNIYSSRLIQQLKVANADLEASHWQLLRSRNTLRALFDSIPTSIYIIDRKYNLAAINMHRAQRAAEVPNLLVGRQCYEALYQRNDVCPDCRVIETLFGNQNTNRTKRQWDPDGETQEWEISTYSIHDDSNQTVQAILLEQDVTEKRRLEATLAQSEKLAAVGQLAAGLAHEINNPLTAIVANAQLLQREIPPDDDKQELVDLISRAGARAAQVVRNLLDLARKEKYDFAPVEINETLRRALKLLQHEFVARSINLVFEPANDLPMIMGSQDHLQGVWINLITNAIDALEKGDCEIRITTRQQGNEVRVILTDNGKGIPPERLSRIFEPFYTTKAPGHGTGLGLSVCHRVIKQHGGRIQVDSQIDVGTQFTVILPVS